MNRLTSTAIVGALLALTGSALAQPGPGDAQQAGDPSASTVQAPPPAMVPVATEIDQGVVDDALSPGAFFAPTALTEPAGTLSASAGGFANTGLDSAVLSHVSLSYAATNQLSISGTLALPGQLDGVTIGALSAKAQVYRAGRVRVGLQGNLLFATGSGDAIFAGLVGAAATLCLDDACNSYASGFAALGIYKSSSTGLPVIISGSAAVQLVPHLKLVAELVTGFLTSEVGGIGNGAVLFYGLRGTHANVGVDVGAATTLGVGNDETVLLATVTARFKP
ncbi:hypothetical protein BH11MYX1_BH11MYX1_08720 [soil metagenome]